MNSEAFRARALVRQPAPQLTAVETAELDDLLPRLVTAAAPVVLHQDVGLLIALIVALGGE
jgi:hypothetical protein